MGAQGTTTRRGDLREQDDTAPLPAALPPGDTRQDWHDRVDRPEVPAVPDEAPLEVEPPEGPPVPQTRRPVPRTVWFFVIVAVLIVAMGLSTGFVIRAVGDANPFKNGLVTQQTIDRSGPAVLKAVNDLGRFQAASGYYEVVIDVEHSTEHVPSFIAGRRVLFVAAGTVDVSVDLASLGSGAVKVDQNRTSATITLPKPQLAPARLDLGRSYVYSEEQGLVDRLRGNSSQDMKEVYDLSTRRLDEAARQSGELTTRAEANTRSMLEGLVRSLGYTNVTVIFR
jgi:Protein of unknown function (DUF4230)